MQGIKNFLGDFNIIGVLSVVEFLKGESKNEIKLAKFTNELNKFFESWYELNFGEKIRG